MERRPIYRHLIMLLISYGAFWSELVLASNSLSFFEVGLDLEKLIMLVDEVYPNNKILSNFVSVYSP